MTGAPRRANAGTRSASWSVLPPSDRQPAQWRWRACRATAGCTLKVTARTSHHGPARRERGLAPVQCPSLAREQTSEVAARCARATIPRISLSPKKHPAQWRSRVGHAKASCALGVTARLSHHGFAPKERFSHRCSALSHRVGQSQPARQGARARQVCVFCHLPRDSQRSGAGASVTQMPAA